jgi:hypothetical protein
VLAPDQIFVRLQAQLQAGLPDWRPSRHSYELLETAPDGAELAHRTWSVQLAETIPQAGRQALTTTGHHCLSLVGLRWLYRLRVEVRDEDYAGALVDELRVLQAALATDRDPELRLQLASSLTRREVQTTTGPLLLGEMRFQVPHQVALTGG